MGRRKIQIQPLTDDRNRTVTFVKRKAGLFKKAHELAVLCQVDLAVIIIGNNNKLYEFSSVDTNEILKVYKNVKTPYESKSPENYGDYKKKKHLNDNVNANIIHDEAGYIDNEDDSDYDSDTPEPKRHKKITNNTSRAFDKNMVSSMIPNVPTFTKSFTKPEESSVGDHHETTLTNNNSLMPSNKRPVLRVQIPNDSKDGTKDSAKTITAIDTNLQSNVAPSNSPPDSANSSSLSKRNSTNPLPSLNTKYTNFPSLVSPDVKKPMGLPMPLPKSQTASPSSATAPQLPSGLPFFSSIVQNSPSNQYGGNAILPTPIFTQALNQQYISHSQQFSNHNQNSTTNNENQNDSGSNKHGQGPTGTPGNPNGSHGGNKFRPPTFNGEQTPISGLPSRYVNDMFPSPSNFYAPQDWPNTTSGMTPIHNNLYFVGMLPSNYLGHRPQQNGNISVNKGDNLPSPLQFPGSGTFNNNNNNSNNGNGNAPSASNSGNKNNSNSTQSGGK